MSKPYATYKTHYKVGEPEGQIYLDKEGACTITITGAASMRQHELDLYGKSMAEGINTCYWSVIKGD